MKIDRQLFEDILSGKLSGKFITSEYGEILSDSICHIYSDDQVMSEHHNTSDRINELVNRISPILVDFIPDVDVAKNELTPEKPKTKQKGGQKSKKSGILTALTAIDELIVSIELLEERVKTIEQILCIKSKDCGYDKNGQIWKSYSQRLDLIDGEIKYFSKKSQRDEERRLADLSDISESIYNVRKSMRRAGSDFRSEIEKAILRYENGNK
jgi:hypothetical protein